MWEEIHIVQDRKNRAYATQAILQQAAISTAVGAFAKDGGKKAFANFKKLVNALRSDADFEPEPLPETRASPRKQKGGSRPDKVGD